MKDLYIESASKSDRMLEMIRESVLSGDLKPGDQLPSEPEMIRQYHVSRGTIREAIVSLVHEGMLYRIQGKGTFVAERPPFRPTIAVVLPYLFFNSVGGYSAGTDVIPRLVQAIEAEARRLGMSIMLYLDNNEVAIERENIVNLLERKMDGVVLYYVGLQENLDCLTRIQEAGIPLVMIDRYVPDIEQDSVTTDNLSGSYRATGHLLEQGFRDIRYITSPLVDSTLRDRCRGYCQALEEIGLPSHVFFLDVSSACIESEEIRAYRTAKQALRDAPSSSTAFLTADAPTLVGVWRAPAQPPPSAPGVAGE